MKYNSSGGRQTQEGARGRGTDSPRLHVQRSSKWVGGGEERQGEGRKEGRATLRYKVPTSKKGSGRRARFRTQHRPPPLPFMPPPLPLREKAAHLRPPSFLPSLLLSFLLDFMGVSILPPPPPPPRLLVQNFRRGLNSLKGATKYDVYIGGGRRVMKKRM